MLLLKQKGLVFAAVSLLLCVSIFSFAVFHNEDGSNTVSFLLTDQYGNKTTHKDLSGTPLLVFFGFTSCADICPIGMTKLSSILQEFDRAVPGKRLTPVFISVDPERDTVERLANYLQGFDDDFVGLTGSRTALERVAAEFNTFLDRPPEKQSHTAHNHSMENQHTSTEPDHSDAGFIENYQLRHSSMIYLVDRYSRVVDYISLDEKTNVIADRLREHLTSSGKSDADQYNHRQQLHG